MKTTFKVLGIILVLFSVAVTAGCNTAAGFGKDMQQGGKDIQKAAQKY